MAFIFLLCTLCTMVLPPAHVAAQLPEGRIVLPDHIIAPPQLRAAVAEALSYYPDLEGVPIHFKYVDRMGNAVMQAQPAINPFCGKRNRSYVVRMRREYHYRNEAEALHDLPREVLVGWLGHELGHICDYRYRSNASMLGFGLAYISSNWSVRRAEDRADSHAVHRGMGEYIIATRKFILRSKGMPESYVQKIGKLYHGPAEIELLMADE